MDARSIPTRAALALSVALLTGCAATIESTSDRLDSVEQAVHTGRVNYQERLDRISLDWICTGMSWPRLVELTGGDRALLNAVMDACAGRIFGLVDEVAP